MRFGGVGILATLVHVLVALCAERLTGLSHQQANLAGFLAAVSVSYFGHLRYTFRQNSHSARHMLRFLVVSGVALATSSAIVQLVTAVGGYGFLTAMILVALVVPPVSFVVMRIWVFNAARKGGHSPD